MSDAMRARMSRRILVQSGPKKGSGSIAVPIVEDIIDWLVEDRGACQGSCRTVSAMIYLLPDLLRFRPTVRSCDWW